jgi:8-oxo-dGTP pyrophosphatase MutT (NUDIX family)
MKAALRELHEETGITAVRIVGSIDEWLAYSFPTCVRTAAPGSFLRYRGQTQVGRGSPAALQGAGSLTAAALDASALSLLAFVLFGCGPLAECPVRPFRLGWACTAGCPSTPMLTGAQFPCRVLQKWYLLEYLGDELEIDLSCHGHPEFSEYSWLPLESLPAGVVDFKRGVYQEVARHFAPEIARRVRDPAVVRSA